MKVTIELEEEDAKLLIASSRRFIEAAEKYIQDPNQGGTGMKKTDTVDAWKRIRDAALEAKSM